MDPMRHLPRLAVVALGLATLVACGSHGDDVARAERRAAEELAAAREQAAKEIAEAEEHVDDARRDFHETTAEAGAALRKAEIVAAGDRADAGYDLAISKAEARHKVALERCEGLVRDSQSTCISEADAALVVDRDAARHQREATLTDVGRLEH